MTDETFLSRWARLKRQSAHPVPEPVAEEPPAQLPVPPVPAPAPEAVPGEPGEALADAAEAEDPLKGLPPVEELTRDSDYTPFLRAEVPEDLHRQALRRLWTSDPVFANDDGLKDYADDYASLFTGNDPVKTLYRVGKGFLDAAENSAGPAEMDDAASPMAEESTAGPQADTGCAAVDETADHSSDMTKPA